MDHTIVCTVRIKDHWCRLLALKSKLIRPHPVRHLFIYDNDNIHILVIMKEPTNPRYPNQADDQNLATKFRNIMQTVLNEDR